LHSAVSTHQSPSFDLQKNRTGRRPLTLGYKRINLPGGCTKCDKRVQRTHQLTITPMYKSALRGHACMHVCISAPAISICDAAACMRYFSGGGSGRANLISSAPFYQPPLRLLIKLCFCVHIYIELNCVCAALSAALLPHFHCCVCFAYKRFVHQAQHSPLFGVRASATCFAPFPRRL
jgi:hypothetical protein